jgi:hypothetical protein
MVVRENLRDTNQVAASMKGRLSRHEEDMTEQRGRDNHEEMVIDHTNDEAEKLKQ